MGVDDETFSNYLAQRQFRDVFQIDSNLSDKVVLFREARANIKPKSDWKTTILFWATEMLAERRKSITRVIDSIFFFMIFTSLQINRFNYCKLKFPAFVVLKLVKR